MRHITIMFVVLFIVCQLPAQFVKRTAQHQPKQMQFKSNARGMVNDIQFSTSVNGPFREPDTIFVNDSLFMKMDVSPLDTIMTEYWLDANQNGILDTTDFNFEGDMLIDNGIGSSDIADLDTTSGIIIAYLNPENPPSMQIIVKAMEDSTIAYGVLVFRNAPAEFMLSGTVYERSNGPVAGLFVRAEDSTRQKMTTTDVSGHYELHLDSGTYRISVTDMFERYTSFDTTMTVQNNVTKDFYVARYTSYISGFVRDEHGTPIPQVGVGLERRNGGGGVQTNSNGYYKMMVLAGSGRIGLSQDDLLPEYMRPEGHDFTLAEGDSIVNDSISNFTCYSTNAFIYGYVFDNEGMPMRSYQIGGWANPLNSYTETHSNGLGMFSLPVRSDTDLNITYQVWLNSENENYPFPPATYADTSYWNVLPGENISFHIIPAETLALDNFNGHYIPPSSSLWDMYGHNNPWGSEAKVMVIDSTLHIRAHSQSGRSGVGVVSRKPYNLKDRDIRVVMNRTELGQKNSAFILLSDERRTWSAPDDFQNWLQLWTGDQGDPGWKLVENVDHTKHVLWETNETAGSDIRFVFEGSSTVSLFIDDVAKYQGSWSTDFSMAYMYLAEENEAVDSASTVYFDEFRVRHRNSQDVREIGGDIPVEFWLEQNYPNPFNPSTRIVVDLPRHEKATLVVYNIIGQAVTTLMDGEFDAGRYEVTWTGRDDFGLQAPTGVYMYKLEAGKFTKTFKMLMVK